VEPKSKPARAESLAVRRSAAERRMFFISIGLLIIAIIVIATGMPRPPAGRKILEFSLNSL
jgi:hypothetical protein